MIESQPNFWSCKHTWRRSSINTLWCLIGCSIGDFGTIAYFQFNSPETAVLIVMGLAIINGLTTSIILETFILMRAKMKFALALKTAFGMSFISMIAMEVAMNSTDYALTGGAILTWWVIPPALLAGYITPLPYNYWRLKKYNKSCH